MQFGDIQVKDGQLYFGTSSPSSCAVFDFSQTTSKGALIPKMTTAQRDAIVSPVEGLFVYNTTTSTLDYYNGSTWGTVAGGSNISATTSDTLTINSDADAAILDTAGLTANRTFDFPDASGEFVITASAQSIGGNKTFTGSSVFSGTATFNNTVSLTAALNTTSSLTTSGGFYLENGSPFTLFSDASITPKFNIDASTGDTGIASGAKLYFDDATLSGSNYITNTTGDNIDIYVNSAMRLRVADNSGSPIVQCIGADLRVASSKYLFLSDNDATDAYIYRYAASGISLGANGEDVLTVNAATNEVYIRTGNQFRLDAAGNTNPIDYYWRITSSGPDFDELRLFQETSSGGEVFQIVNKVDNSGNFVPGIDNTFDCGSSSFRWNDIWATNGTIQTSDMNLKENIIDSDLGLDFINALRPVKYKWKDLIVKSLESSKNEDGQYIYEEKEIIQTFERPHYGLIAQEVQAVMQDQSISDFGGFIHDTDSDRYALRYEEFIAPIIKSIQELAARIEALEG